MGVCVCVCLHCLGPFIIFCIIRDRDAVAANETEACCNPQMERAIAIWKAKGKLKIAYNNNNNNKSSCKASSRKTAIAFWSCPVSSGMQHAVAVSVLWLHSQWLIDGSSFPLFLHLSDFHSPLYVHLSSKKTRHLTTLNHQLKNKKLTQKNLLKNKLKNSLKSLGSLCFPHGPIPPAEKANKLRTLTA